MKTSIHTAIDTYRSLCAKLNIAPEYIANTTLNEHLSILPGDPAVDLSTAVSRYLVIGNGGHTTETIGVATSISAKPRLPQFQGLYNMIPFVLRLPTNDLTVEEASKYRLRRNETHNGQSYVAYYAKVLDLTNLVPVIELETTNAGVVSTSPYTYTSANLVHQTPAAVTDPNISYRLLTSIKVELELTEAEVTELQDACEVIYGAEGFAVISELGLVSGIESTNSAVGSNTLTTVSEIVNAQLLSSSSTGRLLDFGVGSDLTSIQLGSAPAYFPTV